MTFFKDQLKQVFRRLLRAPLFTSIILITLSIGIGANAVVFGVVDGVLLKPLTIPTPNSSSASGIAPPASASTNQHGPLPLLH